VIGRGRFIAPVRGQTAAQGGAIYHSMTTLTGLSPDARQLVADTGQQLDRVRNLADGETEYLHGVIEFYQTVLSVKSTLLGQAQNEKVQQLTEASYAQNEEIKKISAWAAIFFAPYPDRHRVRNELRPHAQVALGDRLSSRTARDGAVVGWPLYLVQTAQVAVTMAAPVSRQWTCFTDRWSCSAVLLFCMHTRMKTKSSGQPIAALRGATQAAGGTLKSAALGPFDRRDRVEISVVTRS
jgi:hypothetical protein